MWLSHSVRAQGTGGILSLFYLVLTPVPELNLSHKAVMLSLTRVVAPGTDPTSLVGLWGT